MGYFGAAICWPPHFLKIPHSQVKLALFTGFGWDLTNFKDKNVEMRKYFGSLCSHFFWDTIWNGYHRRNSQVNIPLITDFCKDRTKNVEVIFGGVGTNSLHSHIFWQIAPIIELDLTFDPRNLPWKFGHDPITRSKVRVHTITKKQTDKQTNKQTKPHTDKRTQPETIPSGILPGG